MSQSSQSEPADSSAESSPVNAPTPIDPTKAKITQQWACTSPLLACRFDPSGRFIFASGEDFSITRIDVASGEQTVFTAHDSWLRSLTFTPDGNTLITAGYDDRIIFWPAADPQPKPQRTLIGGHRWIRAALVSPDGALLATCGEDAMVRLWRIADGTLVRELTDHELVVYSLMFDPSGQFLLSGDLKGQVRQWNLADGALMRTFDASKLYIYDKTFRKHFGGARILRFSTDGAQLACGGLSNSTNAFGGVHQPAAMVFDFQSTEAVRTYVGEANGTLSDIVWDESGLMIGGAWGQGGGWLLFWQGDQDKPVHKLRMPHMPHGIDAHPSEKRIAVACFDKHVRIIDLMPA